MENVEIMKSFNKNIIIKNIFINIKELLFQFVEILKNLKFYLKIIIQLC